MMIGYWLGSVLFFSVLFISTEILPDGLRVSDVMYGIFLLCVLIIFNYSLIAGAINRTVISADNSMVHVVNEPLPWLPYSRELPMKEIKRFIAKERFVLGLPTAIFPRFWHYGVVAQLMSGESVILVGGSWTQGNWATKQQAEYIADCLQMFLTDAADKA